MAKGTNRLEILGYGLDMRIIKHPGKSWAKRKASTRNRSLPGSQVVTDHKTETPSSQGVF